MQSWQEQPMQTLVDQVAAQQRAHGWALMAIHDCSASHGRAFAYTTGFTTALNVPELVVVGLRSRTACRLLNELGERLREMPPEERVRAVVDGATTRHILRPGVDFLFRALGTYQEVGHLDLSALVMGRQDFPIIQLVWADAANHLPTHPKCDPRVAAMQAWPPR